MPGLVTKDLWGPGCRSGKKLAFARLVTLGSALRRQQSLTNVLSWFKVPEKVVIFLFFFTCKTSE